MTISTETQFNPYKPICHFRTVKALKNVSNMCKIEINPYCPLKSIF